MSLERANALWREGKPAEALAVGWAAAADGNGRAKNFVAALLREEKHLLTRAQADALRLLLTDQAIDPSSISIVGWEYVVHHTGLLAGDAAAVARAAEGDRLVVTLLHEDVVAQPDAEVALTAARRHLLLTRSREEYPYLSTALIAQAALNGGAWLFDEIERERLPAAGSFAHAYLPPRPHAGRKADYEDPVTRAVAEQYEAWPYPVWTRIGAADPTTLTARVRAIDPEGPETISSPADILIAGCGSGRQVALSARATPQERFIAIDISRAALDDSAARCAGLGIGGVAYHAMDLHRVRDLGRSFDAVYCTGVLHHLPDPEAGWAALADVLKPGGVMRVMVYSRVGRMRVAALRRMLSDVLERPVTDDLLREVRRRVLALPRPAWPMGRDFFSLAGVHDLLLHWHEDPFDLPRIQRAMEHLGLRLLRFDLPNRRARREHREKFPQDILRRDHDAWQARERADPSLFAGMYDFWCRKPA